MLYINSGSSKKNQSKERNITEVQNCKEDTDSLVNNRNWLQLAYKESMSIFSSLVG